MRPFALLILLAALAGCGRADDERAVSAVTETFLAARAAGDGERACAQLSPETASTLADDEGEPCDEAVTGLQLARSAVERAAVFGIGAKVDLAGGDSYFLELTREGWRISAAGCQPAPPDEPYDCEVEA